MKLTVNNKEMKTEASTLLQLTNELALPEQGVAVAVNNRMIPRAEWGDRLLSERDSVVVVEAACGG